MPKRKPAANESGRVGVACWPGIKELLSGGQQFELEFFQFLGGMKFRTRSKTLRSECRVSPERNRIDALFRAMRHGKYPVFSLFCLFFGRHEMLRVLQGPLLGIPDRSKARSS